VNLRRSLLALIAILAITAGRADALTLRDVIELSRSGLGDQVLIALIEVDRGVFTIDTNTLKMLKEAGISDQVIVALIRSGRTQPPPEAAPVPLQTEAEPGSEATSPSRLRPEVIVIDHHDAQPQESAQIMYPLGYSVPGLWPGFVSPRVVSPRVISPRVVPGTVQTLPIFPSFNGTAFPNFNNNAARVIVPANPGVVRAAPNCVKTQPVFWGFNGKLRPGSWEPAPTVVCQ
jgi:hypothetical protein